jgi:Na+/H+-dicarboxylate symporter
VFGLVCKGFGALEPADLMETLKSLAAYTTVVLSGLAIHTFIVLPAICALLARRNPFRFLAAMLPALVTAWSTGSSSATLPVTIESAEDRANINPKAAAFVLPLGATVNMDGTALYLGVAVIFIAQVYGVPLSLAEVTTIFLTTTLVSIGVAAVPQAGLAMMVIVLNAVGLPLEGIGLVMPIDAILDRFRTVTNVWGDSVGAAYIDRTLPAEEA